MFVLLIFTGCYLIFAEYLHEREHAIDLSAALKNEQECSARKITVLEGKLSDKVEELKIFNSGHSTMQESLQSLQEELEGLHSQLNESNEERKTLRLRRKRDWRKRSSLQKSEKNSAEGKLKRMETKVANLEKEKMEMKEKMAKARSDSLQSGEQKDQAISDFEEKIKEKEEQIAELEQSLNVILNAFLCYVDTFGCSSAYKMYLIAYVKLNSAIDALKIFAHNRIEEDCNFA
jgi:chromosome segregation ATPase